MFQSELIVNKLGIVEESSTVFRCNVDVFALDPTHLALLKKSASQAPLGRARICLHNDNEAQLHEMLIAFSLNSYVCPHMHPGKVESFHVICGAFMAIVFDDFGNVTKRYKLDKQSPFFRINAGVYHTLIPIEDCSIIHEVTNGPFFKNQTINAQFAPKSQKLETLLEYQNQLLAE